MARYAKQQKQTPSYKASTKGMNKSPEQGWKFAGRKETFHRAVVDSNVEVTHRDKFKVHRAGVHNFYTNTTVISIRPRALVPVNI